MNLAIECVMTGAPYTFICNATGAMSKIGHVVVSDNMFCKGISCDKR